MPLRLARFAPPFNTEFLGTSHASRSARPFLHNRTTSYATALYNTLRTQRTGCSSKQIQVDCNRSRLIAALAERLSVLVLQLLGRPSLKWSVAYGLQMPGAKFDFVKPGAHLCALGCVIHDVERQTSS